MLVPVPTVPVAVPTVPVAVGLRAVPVDDGKTTVPVPVPVPVPVLGLSSIPPTSLT